MFCQKCGIKAVLDLNKSPIFKNVYHNNVLRLCSTQPSDDLIRWSKLKLKYSNKQLTSALEIIQENDAKKIKKYNIPEINLKSFSDVKKVESLDELITHDLLKVSDLDNICSAIATKDVKTTKKLKNFNLVSPGITTDKLENLNTVVGLRIGLNYISWSQLTSTGSNCNLLNWHCQNISDSPLNVNLIERIDIASKIASNIPEADAYILEKDTSKQMATIKSSFLKIILRQQQLMSVILTLLASRNNNKENENLVNSIFMMKPYTSSKLFGLYLGNEIVTGNDIVRRLFDQEQVPLNNVSSITFHHELQHYYNSSNQYEKEELNKCFLQTLAFFELVVLEKN